MAKDSPGKAFRDQALGMALAAAEHDPENAIEAAIEAAGSSCSNATLFNARQYSDRSLMEAIQRLQTIMDYVHNESSNLPSAIRYDLRARMSTVLVATKIAQAEKAGDYKKVIEIVAGISPTRAKLISQKLRGRGKVAVIDGGAA